MLARKVITLNVLHLSGKSGSVVMMGSLQSQHEMKQPTSKGRRFPVPAAVQAARPLVQVLGEANVASNRSLQTPEAGGWSQGKFDSLGTGEGAKYLPEALGPGIVERS